MLTQLLALLLTGAVSATETRLADLDLSGMRQGWGQPRVDAAVSGAPLRVAGRAFESGVGTHAASSWALRLGGKATEFRAWVGVQEYADNPGVGSVEFIVRGDGRVLWRSGVLRGRDAAKEARVDLTGVRELVLEVADAGDGIASDHGNWLDAVIVHDGAPLPTPPTDPPVVDLPGDPPNAGAQVAWDEATGDLRLSYDGKLLFAGRAPGATLSTSVETRGQAVTQTLRLTGRNVALTGAVACTEQALAAETRGAAQQAFPLVRTTIGGPSRNLRNNAVYDRGRDWLLAGPDGATRLEPQSATEYRLTCSGESIALVFRPRFYQVHRHLTHYRPWTYRVRQDSITGWCSWWAFMKNLRQSDVDALLAVWREKRLADYGYRYIQIDDCFQGGADAGLRTLPDAQGLAGNPATWLAWRRATFPGGMAGYVAAVTAAGCEPGVWVAASYGDLDVAAQHPEWFVRGADGKPAVGPWIGMAVDASHPEAADRLLRPTWRGLREAGFTYVKIDTLRHYLYDNLHRHPDWCRARGVTPAEVFRRYVGAARDELGPDTFILSCWGVLPEAVGLADACRIGGDGYGPVTMQQYNSLNGLVWRNDPDHCDVYPQFKPAQAGNVTQTASVAAAPADTLIRPALASIAGCLLLLSDKPAVYRDDANLHGLRRAAPVLFSVPGQLYDFDEAKTRALAKVPRATIAAGANPAPLDADQFGPVCPWWLNEIDKGFEHWHVLHRLNWSNQGAPRATVRLADLGLDPAKTWLVYEFWSRGFLGAWRARVDLPALGPMGLASYALREQLDRPQILSTSRHLSHGGVDLVTVEWRDSVLSGRSRVVADDRYELVVHVPAGFRVRQAQIDGQHAEATTDGSVLRVAHRPAATGEVGWRLLFDR
jgi:hypothetical protein